MLIYKATELVNFAQGDLLMLGAFVAYMADTCERLLQKEDIKEFYLGIKEQGARGKRRWKKRKTWR